MFGTVRPCLFGPYGTPGFLAAVFGAREIERHETKGRRAVHVELVIGDSVVVVEAGEVLPAHRPTEASVSSTSMPSTRAPWRWGQAITAPEDKPYGERGCGFRACGNTWWVATPACDAEDVRDMVQPGSPHVGQDASLTAAPESKYGQFASPRRSPTGRASTVPQRTDASRPKFPSHAPD